MWTKMLAVWNESVTLWEIDCGLLKKAGTKAKDLPKKPKWPLKPKLDEEEENDHINDNDDAIDNN